MSELERLKQSHDLAHGIAEKLREELAEALAENDALRHDAQRLRTLDVDNMILRGLVTRMIDGPKAGLTRDVRAWLGRTPWPSK